MAIIRFLDTDCIENIVEKGEIAHFEQFHLFPQCYPKALFFNALKGVCIEKSLNGFQEVAICKHCDKNR